MEETNENIESLEKLIEIPAGYMFDSFLGCTYSANDKTLKAFMDILGVKYDCNRLVSWEKGANCRIFVQQGGYDGERLLNSIRCVKMEKRKNAHAKVYCIKYVSREKTKDFVWKIIVCSANLTNANELNAYVCYEGKADNATTGGEEQTRFIEGVKGLFFSYDKVTGNKSDEYIKSFFQDLNRIDCDKSEFLVTDEDIFETMKKKSQISKESIIISPFLDAEIVNNLSGEQLTLVSWDTTIEDIYQELEEKLKKKGKYYILDLDDDNPAENTDLAGKSLHAKVYIFVSKDNKSADIYIGSANATNSAFYGNIETMIHIPDFDWNDEKKSGLLANFTEYIPQGKNPANEDKAEQAEQVIDSYLRDLVSKFTSNEEYYEIDGVPVPESVEDVKISLKYRDNALEMKETGGKYKWSRADVFGHMVVLEIACVININGNKFEEFRSKSLMVEGKENSVDETALMKEQQEIVAKALLSNPNNKKGTVQRNTSSDITKGTDITRPSLTIYDVICKVKTEEEAEMLINNFNGLKDRLGSDDKELLEYAIGQIKELYECTKK